jgi:hypothetical protein
MLPIWARATIDQDGHYAFAIAHTVRVDGMRFASPRTGRHVPFAFAATALAALAVQWTTEPRRADRENL